MLKVTVQPQRQRGMGVLALLLLLTDLGLGQGQGVQGAGGQAAAQASAAGAAGLPLDSAPDPPLDTDSLAKDILRGLGLHSRLPDMSKVSAEAVPRTLFGDFGGFVGGTESCIELHPCHILFLRPIPSVMFWIPSRLGLAGARGVPEGAGAPSLSHRSAAAPRRSAPVRAGRQ